MSHFKPFSVTITSLIQDILGKEKIIEKYAGMAIMERIKGLSSTVVRGLVLPGATPDRTIEDSPKLRQAHDVNQNHVIMQIREEMKPLVKVDDMSEGSLLQFISKPSRCMYFPFTAPAQAGTSCGSFWDMIRLILIPQRFLMWQKMTRGPWWSYVSYTVVPGFKK